MKKIFVSCLLFISVLFYSIVATAHVDNEVHHIHELAICNGHEFFDVDEDTTPEMFDDIECIWSLSSVFADQEDEVKCIEREASFKTFFGLKFRRQSPRGML